MHYGKINNIADNVHTNFTMSSHQELTFDIYKVMDGEECELWDKITDFKYIYVPEHDDYYQITISTDDTNSVVKHVTAKSAGECELSQRYLRNFHCNDETDILRDDYEPTIFYDPQNHDRSLLHRVLHDKYPDWSIGHVDEGLVNIQRTFTTDASTVYDFLTNTVAKEIECLFKFDGKNRMINVYDLMDYCRDCKKRMIAKYVPMTMWSCWQCSNCGAQFENDVVKGYGRFANVLINTSNFANQITVTGNTDNVKNCFNIVGGDDLITATVRNMNPNGSSYIYNLSKSDKEEMPAQLKQKLEDYEELYNSIIDEYERNVQIYYEAVDDELYYQTKMAPETPIPSDTTAQQQLNILMNTTFTVATDSTSLTKTVADGTVKSYARVLIDPRYTVDVFDSVLNNNVWQGKFTVKSLGGLNTQGEEDKASSDTRKSVAIQGDYADFLNQKIQKTLDRNDAGLVTIFNIQDDNAFKDALTEYSLDRLSSFESSYSAILEVLQEPGIADTNKFIYYQDMYNTMYLPYYRRHGYIQDEIKVRERDVASAHQEVVTQQEYMNTVHEQLDLPTYLGNLYTTFLLYIREDTYTNSNYISDGLDNSEVIEKAGDLYEVARKELYKASELQYTLSGTLSNFLGRSEFSSFRDTFDIGDWIMCESDDRLFRLRIVEVDYTYNDQASINITFSNVTKVDDVSNDFADIISRAQSMATSFDYVAHQAKQGGNTSVVIENIINQGLDSALVNVKAGTNQDIVIDDHGILARQYDDISNTYLPTQMKITSNTLAFTSDNWETASLGLGKQKYVRYNKISQAFENPEDYGITSKFVTAGYIYGTQIISGDIYSYNYSYQNKVGTYINLVDGTFTMAGEKLKWDGNNLVVNGNITTTYGSIGGWNIGNTSIYKGSVGLSSNNSNNSNVAIWAGSSTANNAPFRVQYDGTVIANKMNITGGRINVTATDVTDSSADYIEILGYNPSGTEVFAARTRANRYGITHYLVGTNMNDSFVIKADSLTFSTNWGHATTWYNLTMSATEIAGGDCDATFKSVTSGSPVVVSSDRNVKKDIKNLDKTKTARFIYSLSPKSFIYKKDETDTVHHGLIAQDVRICMDGEGWGLYNENENGIGLRYEELIADLIATVQTQDDRIKELERMVDIFE